ncbi:MAG: hypothetical protein KJ624_03520 [Chloroflexi bacterium]|nr:hypothetical protein [Chloroflexota bacterium]
MRNQRKSEILSLLEDGDSWTASEVEEALGVSPTDASELLRRYHKYGLLVRQRLRGPGAPPRAYGYRITEKGICRLDWLRSHSKASKCEEIGFLENESEDNEWEVEFA